MSVGKGSFKFEYDIDQILVTFRDFFQIQI